MTRVWSELEIGRLEKLAGQLYQSCSSQKAFRKSLAVDMAHLSKRSAQTGQGARLAIQDEQIASIIRNGILVYDACKVGPKLECAFDGKVVDFEGFDMESFQDVKWPELNLRVVVRESSPLHVVVTLYVMGPELIAGREIPEVPHVIW
jgi:hypothetical protein